MEFVQSKNLKIVYLLTLRTILRYFWLVMIEIRLTHHETACRFMTGVVILIKVKIPHCQAR